MFIQGFIDSRPRPLFLYYSAGLIIGEYEVEKECVISVIKLNNNKQKNLLLRLMLVGLRILDYHRSYIIEKHNSVLTGVHVHNDRGAPVIRIRTPTNILDAEKGSFVCCLSIARIIFFLNVFSKK